MFSRELVYRGQINFETQDNSCKGLWVGVLVRSGTIGSKMKDE